MKKNKDPLFQIPRVGIGVMVVKNGKVLFGRRTETFDGNCWSFPGGKPDFGESLEDCAKRETREECGIEIKNIQFATITNDVFEFKGEEFHYVTVWMEAEYDSGELMVSEPHKFAKWQWLDWNWENKEEFDFELMKPFDNLYKIKQNPFKYI